MDKIISVLMVVGLLISASTIERNFNIALLGIALMAIACLLARYGERGDNK